LHVQEGVVERQAAQRERMVLGDHQTLTGDALFDVALDQGQVASGRLRTQEHDHGQRGRADQHRYQQQRADELGL
jgi:hypothetical protein